MTKPVIRVKELLKEKGLTMENLRTRMGMNNLSALGQSVNGNPTLERLQEIADALEVPIAALFDTPPGDNTITCPNCGTAILIKAEIEHKGPEHRTDPLFG